MANRGLAFKLSAFILFATAIIFVAAFSYDYRSSTVAVLKNVAENAKNLTRATALRIETVTLRAETVARSLAALIEHNPPKKAELLRLMQVMVRENRQVFGSAVAFDAAGALPEFRGFAPYFCREGSQLMYSDLATGSYNYSRWDWFQIPKVLGRPIWSEPYFDEGGGNIIMSSFSVPIYRREGAERKFQGVVTADLSLQYMKEIVSSVRIYDTGYAFLVSRNGVFVTYPDESFVMRESLFSIAEKRGDPALRALGKRMIAGEEGFTPLMAGNPLRPSFVYHAPISSSGWQLVVVIPENELFADVRTLAYRTAAIVAAGLLLVLLATALISGSVTRPLRALARTSTEIARGNLDIALPHKPGTDEIGALSRSFDDMRTALKEYIANLAETTAAKERIESELKIARTIQMSFLPKRFPPFPEKDAFEIYATLDPAKQVGGDLYDFFLLDDNRLFFSVGDVSDKGVPAALFMAVTKTLMKGFSEAAADPAGILSRVNDELAVGNESMMFVTVFCGVFDFTTGELFYSNAGHPPPLVIEPGGATRWLHLPEGVVMGCIEGAEYRTERVRLAPGETLLAYTDGVTEAVNAAGDLFGAERLSETLQGAGRESAQRIVTRVMEEVTGFSRDTPQADDITVLALRYRGSGAA